jgi:halocyanin-like protein
MQDETTRRWFVRELGVAAVVASMAGCSGDGGDGSDGEDATPTGTPAPTDTPTPTGTPTPTETQSATPTETQSATDTPTPADGGGQSEIDEYLSGTSNYDGTLADRTGQDEVVVEVGAEGNGGGFAFGPAAIRVDSGTTVVWEWIGEGGLHNVVAEDGSFDSGAPVSGADATFEHTFTGSGTWLYFCNPHKALGMKGAVVVP